MKCRFLSRWAVAGSALFLPALASAQILYDPAAGTLPQAQGWSYLALPVAAQVSVTDGSTLLNTQSLSQILAGFSRVAPVPLDRVNGFTLRFTLKLLAEDHGTRLDRAGLSVTVLAADRKGIELGFWADRIWAQSEAPLFTHAEDALWNSTADFTDFALTMTGDTYALSANDTPVLTGPVRDYTPFVGLIDPYETPNFLFFGDNTTSARASFALRQIELTTLKPAPPILSVELAATGLILTWPITPSSPFLILKATDQLGTEANWQSITDPITSDTTQHQVTLPVTEAHRYFRLTLY